MDRLSWLDAVAAPREGALQPPPVSFRFASNPALSTTLKHENAAPPAESVPLSLTAADLSLEESKTYMRWYLDILARTNQRTVLMADVHLFLGNFRLSGEAQEQINRIFSKILQLINIGEFFAVLRVVAHTLQGRLPERLLIRVPAPVPAPPSILLKKRQSDDDEKLDLESFTEFMLTGLRPDRKKPKLVKFSDEVAKIVEAPQPLDYSLPMDQLLGRMALPDPEEREILADVQTDTFQNLHSVDTMLVDGVSNNIHFGAASPQPLRPNVTGPADMRRVAPGLASLLLLGQVSQATAANTLLNARARPEPPAGRRVRLQLLQLTPTMGNPPYLPLPLPLPMPLSMPLSAATPPEALGAPGPSGPPPPPRRRGSSLASDTRPPLPPKIEIEGTTNILDDLKALQAEVDKIRDMTGGF